MTTRDGRCRLVQPAPAEGGPTSARGPRPRRRSPAQRRRRRRLTFWAGLVVGWVFIAIGLKGVLDNSGVTRPRELLVWFVGAGVVHEALFAPAAIAVGWLTARFVPVVARAPVRVALALTAVVVVVFWPLVRGYGRRPALPSALPLDYGRNLAFVVIVIWAATGAWVAWRWRVMRVGGDR
ncbi:MAG: hypothetical protein ACT4PW_00415 [Acidimicrobiia bacterium]